MQVQQRDGPGLLESRYASATSPRDDASDAMLRHARWQAPDLSQNSQQSSLGEGFSTAHFFLKKRAPSNAPPTATAAGIPKPNSGAGPLQVTHWANAGVAAMTKETAPRIIRISDSITTLLPNSALYTIKPEK